MTTLEPVPYRPRGRSFYRDLCDVVKAGKAAAAIDEHYGTDLESDASKVGFRLGPYASKTGAIEARRRANTVYGSRFGGEFEGYPEAVEGGSEDRRFLVIRFIPGKQGQAERGRGVVQ